MLRVCNIAKSFGGRKILHDVSFNVAKSEILIITGRNGSGKSTLLNVLSRLISEDSGSVDLDNVKFKDTELWKEKTAFVSHELMFAENQTVEFTLNFYRKFFNVDEAKFMENVQTFEINELNGKRVGELSTGEARRLSMCVCFMRDAECQLFDEPLVNLDENFRARFLENLKKSLTQRITIIATHNPQAFVALQPKFSILKDGFLFQPENQNSQDILAIISSELAQ